MPITRSEVLFRTGKNTTQTTAHGGKMDWQSEVPNAVLSAFISDFTQAERTAGATRWYKIFLHNADDGNLAATDVLAYLSKTLTGDYVASLKSATLSNTYNDVSAARKFGVGTLATALSPGDSTIVIDTRGAAYAHFQNGDEIIIHNKAGAGNTGVDDNTGAIEKHVISGAPVWNGDEVTITLVGQIASTFATSRTVGGETVLTYVASCPPSADAETSVTVQNNTSVAGTLDVNEISAPNIGAIDQTITLTFTSGTAFTAVSNDAGVTLPAGSISTTYAPLNSESGTALISIPPTAWGGTFLAGDSVQVPTTPAAFAFFLIVECPAGASATQETVDLRFYLYSGSA
jgi:hypothetical protein